MSGIFMCDVMDVVPGWWVHWQHTAVSTVCSSQCVTAGCREFWQCRFLLPWQGINKCCL